MTDNIYKFKFFDEFRITDNTLTVYNVPDNIDGNEINRISGLAFSECTNAKEIILPNTIDEIERNSFSNCVSLEKINIPEKVVIIDGTVFRNCKKLSNIEVDPKNKNYRFENGSLVDMKHNDLIFSNSGYIKDGVKSISGNINSDTLTEIILSETVEYIDCDAFENCPNLKYNKFDNALYLGTKQNPYKFLIKAESDEITSCKIHEDTEIILAYAFVDCKKLLKINIPKKVRELSGLCFSGCTSLEQITVDQNNKKYISEGNCIIEPETETLVCGCKNSVIPSTVKTVGSYSFHYHEEIENFVFPEGIELIDWYSFENCTNLKSITLPSTLKEIGHCVFSECENLNEVIYHGTPKKWSKIQICTPNYDFDIQKIKFVK